MLPARRVAGFLHVQTEIDLVCEHLDVTLWLHPAAHDTECLPRFAIFHHEPGNNGVKWAFPRRVSIRVVWVHGKEFTTILKHESEARHDDTAAHPAIITLNERDHVALVIGSAHVDRVTLIERRIASRHRFCGVIW